ncbi:DUF6907 domain-containing protein [Streptomyces polygonati]|uniref:DUF6907 domain-containing protein n=1 Tax=Streptomyces polygonati TaxID=1617087 RepID=A0ABV8HW39_9ACTN
MTEDSASRAALVTDPHDMKQVVPPTREEVASDLVSAEVARLGSPLDPPDMKSASPASGRTWTIGTTAGFTATGYLPAWAEEDPSDSGVPLDELQLRLADINHWTHFDGQTMQVRLPAFGGEASQVGEAQVFRGSIDCNPYAEEPEPRVPVVNLAIIEDFWINDLDPEALGDLAAKLRAQADRLDHEIRPRLIDIRADWAQHRSAQTPLDTGSSDVLDRDVFGSGPQQQDHEPWPER